MPDPCKAHVTFFFSEGGWTTHPKADAALSTFVHAHFFFFPLLLLHNLPHTHTMAAPLEPNRHTSLLHAGYHHPLHRTWQVAAPISPEMLMYPIFVTDNDDVEEKIDTLPGQSR